MQPVVGSFALLVPLAICACGAGASGQRKPTATPPVASAAPSDSADPEAPVAADPTTLPSDPLAPVGAAPAPAAPLASGGDPAALLREGQAAFDMGDLNGARTALQRAALQQPDLVEAQLLLGLIAEKELRVPDAKEAYRRVLSADPNHEIAAHNLAGLYLRAGETPAGIADLRALAQGAPDSLALRNAKHRLMINGGQVDAAIREAKEVLRKDESNLRAMLNLAVAYYHQGRYELALDVLNNVGKRDPANAEVSYRRAFVRLKQKRRALAIKQFEEALEKRPDFPEACNNLGVLYLEAGDYPSAAAQFRRAIELAPDFRQAYLNLGSAHRGQGEQEAAEQAYRRAMDLGVPWPPAHFNLGILFLETKAEGLEKIRRLKDAIDEFQRYRTLMGPRLKRDDPVDSYQDEARRLIEVEQQRLEAERAALKEAEESAAEQGTPAPESSGFDQMPGDGDSAPDAPLPDDGGTPPDAAGSAPADDPPVGEGEAPASEPAPAPSQPEADGQGAGTAEEESLEAVPAAPAPSAAPAAIEAGDAPGPEAGDAPPPEADEAPEAPGESFVPY